MSSATNFALRFQNKWMTLIIQVMRMFVTVLNIFLYTFLGPVVQSVISLTCLLRVISLTVLADSVYNILIFFAEKM